MASIYNAQKQLQSESKSMLHIHDSRRYRVKNKLKLLHYSDWRIRILQGDCNVCLSSHIMTPLEWQPWLAQILRKAQIKKYSLSSPDFQKSNIKLTNLSIDQMWATIHCDGRDVSLLLVVLVSRTSGRDSNSDGIVPGTSAPALSGIPFHYFALSDFISFISVSAANLTRSI